jgi:hypothetical protein
MSPYRLAIDAPGSAYEPSKNQVVTCGVIDVLLAGPCAESQLHLVLYQLCRADNLKTSLDSEATQGMPSTTPDLTVEVTSEQQRRISGSTAVIFYVKAYLHCWQL